MKRDIFIGGAWPYANYYLHVGHLAALLPGDILAKYYRLNKDNVIYVSGSDCHGTPITERAKKENKTPSEISDFYHNEDVKTFNNMNFEYDMYSKTASQHHHEYVMECFKKLVENGYIYEKEIEQDYCDNCKTFLSDREIKGTCPHCGSESTGDQCDSCMASLDSTEVLDKHCKSCGNSTTVKNNKHLYFKLSAFEEQLKSLIEKNKDIWRKNAVGESQKYLDMGLIDRAATRQLEWGIKIPVDGYDDKRIYVWFEAVLGYLSVGYEVAKQRGISFDEFMSNDNQNLKTYYVHGKDNIVFHSIIFPALILGLNNNYRLVDHMVSSAYVNLNNEKMSKSKGNMYSVNQLLEHFTSDTIRFYFTLNGPETKDTSCSIEDLIQTHNKFLVGVLGNFINRNLSFIVKKFDGVIKEGIIDSEIIELTQKTYKNVSNYIEKAELKNALNEIIEYVTYGNKYYDLKQPWIQVKENITEFNNTTYTCVYMMANLANLVAPFIPNAANKIKDMLKLGELNFDIRNISGDIKIDELVMLFDRIDDKVIEEFKSE